MNIKLVNVYLFFCFQILIFPQTDWDKWEKTEIDYRLPDNSREREYNFISDNVGEFLAKSFTNTYWFFISDVDGDNCPFTPSCSGFFIDAVKETNIIQGSLMFFDRFTRDLNIFKYGKYPVDRSKHYYDPASLYSLSGHSFKYIPPGETVTLE